jgi:transcriptional regulator GlxA family with amidase domain
MSNQAQSISLAMLILPNFNMMVTTGFLDPFRAANYLHEWQRYQWQYLAMEPATCTASNGMTLHGIKPLSHCNTQFDMVAVSASWTPEAFADRNILAWLRKQDRNGAMIGGLDTGAFILGYAGLLGDYSAVTHFEHHTSFAEIFSDHSPNPARYSLDDRRFSCGGGVSAVDLGLAILSHLEDPVMIKHIERYLYHHPNEHNNSYMVQDRFAYDQSLPGKLKQAIDYMQAHLEEPEGIATIADMLRISQRQLERDFKHYLNATPKQFYLRLRLDQARMMISQTDLSILEIAVATGFSSQEHFSRIYKKTFHNAPSHDRNVTRIPFQFR